MAFFRSLFIPLYAKNANMGALPSLGRTAIRWLLLMVGPVWQQIQVPGTAGKSKCQIIDL